MASIVLLAQALPTASSGVDWLYQFTNNLTNLTTQNGGALTQLGITELACISFFMLVSIVINWQTSKQANGDKVLRGAAQAYKVDTDAIALKV